MAACNFTIPRRLCTLDTCCVEKQGVIDYQPSLGGNVAYAAILGAILLAQACQLVYFHAQRTWGFFVGVACCLVLEVVGYVGRVLMHNNPFDLNNFIIYLVCLTIAPAFLMAAVYVCFGRVVAAVGARHSRLPPHWYAIVCVGLDLVSLVLQALGGALAATNVKSAAPGAARDETGVHILVAGLAFQLFATVTFAALCADFAWSVHRASAAGAGVDRNSAFVDLVASRRFCLFLGALALATLTVFVRSAFRVAELRDGFGSALANNQTLFMVFEGPMIIVAALALTVIHPGFAFKGRYAQAGAKATTQPATGDRAVVGDDSSQEGGSAELSQIKAVSYQSVGAPVVMNDRRNY